ncbi:hypothetical protein ANCDUO_26466 [Ancylostoma duodenale]|uniref:Cytochrome b-c1 complex subunit 7 n=1 Tax=Ancylostoma duodenale TaxID=51022 RepID=A0A0C2C1R9_9BILA|nr:hypothetical protein ANCDUO_26466 [Ancylostoma duodenale]
MLVVKLPEPVLKLCQSREYGLLFHDSYFEPAPEVTEALRRLNLKEPHLFDQRKMRLSHAHTLALHGERLPKNQWTKWEDVGSSVICCGFFSVCWAILLKLK